LGIRAGIRVVDDAQMQQGPIRVVIADDVEALRALVRIALEEYPDIKVAGEASDGHEAVAAARDLAPDVMLLDVSMPGYDGLEALIDIRELAPCVEVVMLSGFAATRLAPQALELGAHSYLEKGVSFDEIAAAVRAAAAAQPRLS
jgi:DNA-binding NarL/FixJ family response regulator